MTLGSESVESTEMLISSSVVESSSSSTIWARPPRQFGFGLLNSNGRSLELEQSIDGVRELAEAVERHMHALGRSGVLRKWTVLRLRKTGRAAYCSSTRREEGGTNTRRENSTMATYLKVGPFHN